MTKTSVLMTFLVATVLIQKGAAAVDFSAITDLINATVTVISVLVTNTSTLVGAAILGGTIAIVGVIIAFISRLLMNVIGKIGHGRS